MGSTNRRRLRTVLAFGLVIGCAGSGSSTPPRSTAGTGGTSTGVAGTGGRSDSTGGSAGLPGSAGTTAGAAGGVGNRAGSGGGNAGASGGATGGAAAGAAGTPGQAGTGGSAPVGRGGASAKAICAAGASYGKPLDGVDTSAAAITTIGPPNTPPASYFAFVEGPVWVARLSTLFFSDNAGQPAERIFSVVPPATVAKAFAEDTGSNGLALDADDNLIVADQRMRRITRRNSTDGSLIDVPVPAGAYKPNDVIVRSDGTIYFTDPDSGFYRAPAGGAVGAAIKKVNRPNGIELDLNETTLYVGDVGNKTISSFKLDAAGNVDEASMKLFATTVGTTVDGMAVDCAGNVYAGTQTGVEIFSPEGMPLGVVPTGESSNCTFGGADRKTLFVTSRSVVKAIKLNVPGLPN